MTNPVQLEPRDLRILDLLQQDCRISNADLAGAVGMSASALWRRVRALEDTGVIERYGAVLDPEAMGLGFQAIVHVHLTRHDPDRIVEFIRAVDGQVELGRFLERRETDTERLRLGPRTLRGRVADDIEPVADQPAQNVDKKRRRGACAEAEPHARPHEFGGARGGAALGFVL